MVGAWGRADVGAGKQPTREGRWVGAEVAVGEALRRMRSREESSPNRSRGDCAWDSCFSSTRNLLIMVTLNHGNPLFLAIL
jgi:hypothetical protein